MIDTPRYPATLEIIRPPKLERPQLALRFVIVGVLWILGIPVWLLFPLLYVLIPTVAAVMLSQHGPARFFGQDARRLTRLLQWIVSVYAFLMLLTDRLPGSDERANVRFEVSASPSSHPTLPSVKSALARLVLSLPNALVLALLMILGWVWWLVAALFILLTESYPYWLYDFERGVLRWQARLFAYHASLVDAYPPFTLEVGIVEHEPSSA
jgi:hypothetical protein